MNLFSRDITVGKHDHRLRYIIHVYIPVDAVGMEDNPSSILGKKVTDPLFQLPSPRISVGLTITR